MITQTAQTMYTHHRRVCRMAMRRSVITMHSGLLYGIVSASLALGLVSCAEFTDVRADIARLQSDLNTNSETLAKISARVDALERRESSPGSISGLTRQELIQALEVLLKKALEAESRLTAIESAGPPVRGAEKPAKQTRQAASDTKGSSAPRGSDENDPRRFNRSSPLTESRSAPEAKQISLGMAPEDVRRALGDPIRTEASEAYIFWYYSRVNNQKYVIFEKSTGRVSGWWGL
jgi:hypothetical protein